MRVEQWEEFEGVRREVVRAARELRVLFCPGDGGFGGGRC